MAPRLLFLTPSHLLSFFRQFHNTFASWQEFWLLSSRTPGKSPECPSRQALLHQIDFETTKSLPVCGTAERSQWYLWLCSGGKVVSANPAEDGSLVLPAPSSCPADLLQRPLRRMSRTEQSSPPRPGVSGLPVQSFQTSRPMTRTER